MVLFLKILVLAVAKKAAVFAAARFYGLPRVYRRVLRVTNARVQSQATRSKINRFARRVISLGTSQPNRQ